MKGPVGKSFFEYPVVIVHHAGDPFEGHGRNLVQFQFTLAKEKLLKDLVKNVIPHEIHRYEPTKNKLKKLN